MGYFIVGFLVLVLVGGVIAALTLKGRGRAVSGTLACDHPVVRSRPSADAPTPGASVVANPTQQENAEQKTPPA